MKSISKLIVRLLVVASLMSTGLAMAQAEPSMGQIYATAQAGKLDDAQLMVQQVLISHPKSAKAHFVRAELYARQGQVERAREALATAEQYAPGLPFAKPDAVQALRAQLNTRPVSKSVSASTGSSYAASPVPAQPSTSWMLPLLLAGGVVVAGYFIFRRRTPQAIGQQPVYAGPQGLSGPQTFGTGGGVPQPAYAQGGFPQGVAQPAGTGMGGRIMGGVATGLAVGAGVMAAQAIGRNLFDGNNHGASSSGTTNNSNNFEPIATNTDMGGANFGINDTSWDDAGGGDAGGGSDWDN